MNFLESQFKDRQREMASDRALNVLTSYAKQLSSHRGKFGSFVLILLEELELAGNAEAIQAFRKSIEPEYGRYLSRAPKPPQKKIPIEQKPRVRMPLQK